MSKAAKPALNVIATLMSFFTLPITAAGSGVAAGTFTTATKAKSSMALTPSLQIGTHALQQMAARNITTSMVKSALRNGRRFYDPKNGTINYVLKNGFVRGKDLLVGTNPFTGRITTAFRGTKLIRPRFIPIK